jgi:hypothetical protein
MNKIDMVKPYVEKVLKEYLQSETLIIDDDGDVPIRVSSAMYYVRVLDRDPVMVQLFAPLVRNVKKSAKLLEAINQINSEIIGARVFWHDDDVMVATEMLAETLDPAELSGQCGNIGSIADNYDNKLQEEFGGEVFFTEPEGEESVDV